MKHFFFVSFKIYNRNNLLTPIQIGETTFETEFQTIPTLNAVRDYILKEENINQDTQTLHIIAFNFLGIMN